ncbi:MAG: Uma2 family endonuclease [Saprospirales bacterium]|nr:Uma2 family endonuclease [Saprospirales bacterium]
MSSAIKFPLTNIELAEAGGDKGPVYFPASFAEYWEVLAEAEYRADYYDRQIIATMSYESDLHSHFASELGFLLKSIFPDPARFRVYNSNRPVYIEECEGSETGVFNADGMVIALPSSRFEYRPGMNAEKSPVILIEVLSDSTRHYDFGTKLPCYKKIPALRQILFVEQNEPGVLVFEREAPNRWSELSMKAADEFFTIEGQAITLGQIYRGVYF